MFSKNTYISRREKLRKSVGSGIILLIGNDESPMNYADNGYHFRQDSSFLYFCGLNQPSFVAVFDCESGDDCLFGNDLTIDDFVWMGPQPSIEEQALKAGISRTAALDTLPVFLKEAQLKGRKIHFLPPYRAEHKIKLFNWLGILPGEVHTKASLELILAIINQRNYKSDEEIKQIENACNTSVDMHTLAMRLTKPGVKEAEIAAKVTQVALESGGQLAFPVIATINGQTLHNHFHGNILKEGDLFLLDAGAETDMGYAGDLSSTVPVSGKFTQLQTDIYKLCLKSHNRSIELLKPGIPFGDIYFEACRVIVDGMKDLGFMKGNTEDALVNGAHAMFFPCGLGHMMGLDVHDMENLGEIYVGYDGKPKSTQFGLKSLRLARKLEPGFVLTIEPGIYFIPQLIDLWKSTKHNAEYLNFDKLEQHKDFGGLRNEENFLITTDGCKLLGKPKPKTIDDVLNEWAKGN
ncbi:MAG: aminopeptidase P family protein [Bacteroidales bacterium]